MPYFCVKSQSNKARVNILIDRRFDTSSLSIYYSFFFLTIQMKFAILKVGFQMCIVWNLLDSC